MKIAQLLSGVGVHLSNEETQFVNKHHKIKIESLSEKDLWLAQNLVRKGIYEISTDNKLLIKKLNETD